MQQTHLLSSSAQFPNFYGASLAVGAQPCNNNGDDNAQQLHSCNNFGVFQCFQNADKNDSMVGVELQTKHQHCGGTECAECGLGVETVFRRQQVSLHDQLGGLYMYVALSRIMFVLLQQAVHF